MQSVPLVPAVKHLIAARTGDAGWRRVLPPLAPLSPDQVVALDRAIADADA